MEQQNTGSRETVSPTMVLQGLPDATVGQQVECNSSVYYISEIVAAFEADEVEMPREMERQDTVSHEVDCPAVESQGFFDATGSQQLELSTSHELVSVVVLAYDGDGNELPAEMEWQNQGLQEADSPGMASQGSLDVAGFHQASSDNFITEVRLLSSVIPKTEDVSNLDDGKFHQTFSTYVEFRNALAEHEIANITKYIIINTRMKDFKENTTIEDIAKGDHMIRWTYVGKDDNLPIRFTGVPHIFLGKEKYECCQGRDRKVNQKQHYLQSRHKMQAQGMPCKTRRNIQPTKKLGCPVIFTVKKLFLFDSFFICKDSNKRRSKMAKILKEALASKACGCDDSVNGRLVYICCFPDISAHRNHLLGEAAGLMETLDPRLGEYLKNGIRNGCRDTDELLRCSKRFVNEVICPDQKNIPQLHRRRFVPSRKKIKNLVQTVKRETQKFQLEQENVAALEWAELEDIQENNPQDDEYSEDKHNPDGNEHNGDEENFCFLYQNSIREKLNVMSDLTYIIKDVEFLEDIDNKLSQMIERVKTPLQI